MFAVSPTMKPGFLCVLRAFASSAFALMTQSKPQTAEQIRALPDEWLEVEFTFLHTAEPDMLPAVNGLSASLF